MRHTPDLHAIIIIIMKVFLLASTLAVAAATPLVCKTGAITTTNTKCSTTTKCASPYEAQDCTQEKHKCLTAKWAGGWDAAYGCYPSNVVSATKTAIQNLCKADASCVKSNPTGKPGTWTSCNTDNCNTCNGAGALAPSLALLAVTLFASVRIN